MKRNQVKEYWGSIERTHRWNRRQTVSNNPVEGAVVTTVSAWSGGEMWNAERQIAACTWSGGGKSGREDNTSKCQPKLVKNNNCWCGKLLRWIGCISRKMGMNYLGIIYSCLVYCSSGRSRYCFPHCYCGPDQEQLQPPLQGQRRGYASLINLLNIRQLVDSS